MTTPPSTGSRSIFLIGFMATGKSTVGRLLADALSLPFIDLDDVVEQAASKSIRAIFAQDGEAAFRDAEARALARVADGPAAVIASGGGAPCHGDNLTLMRSRGLVIALTAPVEVVKQRVADPSTRPLLSEPEPEVRALYDRRVAWYRQAHASVRTEEHTPDSVARIVARLVEHTRTIPDSSLANTTVLALSDRTYPIIVEAGALDRLGELARGALSATRVGLISDDNVAPLYGERARATLEAAGFEVCEVVVPAGETTKCISEFARVSEALVSAGLDRRSAIIALGGGVVGDLAGFVAASLFRGIDVIQVPTTVLAMVDSAIGGKTGINIEAGKNLIGAFWQPRLVLADPEVLATLPVRERRAAFGELVKYALLDGEDLYRAVEQLAPALCSSDAALAPALCSPDEALAPALRSPDEALAPALRSPDAAPARAGLLEHVIRRCAGIKSWIVSRDEREQTGERALLNLGHTVGHAIEVSAGYGTLLHGEAVGLGLIATCRVSAALDLCDPGLETRVADTLRRAGLDADLDPWLRADVLSRIGVDKKRTGSRIRFVTVRQVGVCGLTALDLTDLTRILRPENTV